MSATDREHLKIFAGRAGRGVAQGPPLPLHGRPPAERHDVAGGPRRLAAHLRALVREHRSARVRAPPAVASAGAPAHARASTQGSRLTHRARPCTQNHTREYFEMVVRSGGVEGKFVQRVYPYVYLVRDVGKGSPVIVNRFGIVAQPFLLYCTSACSTVQHQTDSTVLY